MNKENFDELSDEEMEGVREDHELLQGIESGDTPGGSKVIEDASEKADAGKINWTEEDELESDMEKLAAMEHNIEAVEGKIKGIEREINTLIEESGLGERKESSEKSLKDMKKDFSLLKKDIKKRSMRLFKKDMDDIHPVKGVTIKDYGKDKVEMVLDRDEEGWPKEAVAWAVEKELLTLLTVRDDKWMKSLESGVFEDQPGEIVDVDDYRVFVSTKPYRGEEE